MTTERKEEENVAQWIEKCLYVVVVFSMCVWENICAMLDFWNEKYIKIKKKK